MKVKKWIFGIGIELIILMFLLIGVYVWRDRERTIQPIAYPVERQADMTIEGYEESEELIKYMLCQITDQNLDLALRGCAFQNIAECFCLNYYTKYLNRFENIDLIPPSDADSPAYISITNARLAFDYAKGIQQLMNEFQSGDLRLLGIEDDVPELQDGVYYETRNKVCEIIGARSLEEKKIYIQVNGKTLMLRWTLARYRKYWNVLYFHPLQDMAVEAVSLEDCVYNMEHEIMLREYEEDILPCNYYLLNDNCEEDPYTLIKRFFLYLQREDAQSAMSYMDVYGEEEIQLSAARLECQKQAALKIQKFYYKTFLHDEEYMQWIFKDISERGSDLTKALSTTNMLFTGAEGLYEIWNDGLSAQYDLYWSYESVWFKGQIFMENKNGWKITDIVW